MTFTGAWLDVADLDGNGRPDLVGTSGSNATLAMNGGTSGFTSRSIAMAPGVGAIRAADVDGDGRLDLAAVASAPALVIRRGGPSLVFESPQSTALPSRAHGLALGDLDGDGDLDAVTTLPDSARLAVLLNQGGGNFGAARRIDVGGTFTEPLIADFTGDGRNDLLVAVYAPEFALMLMRGQAGGGLADPDVVLQTTQYRYSLSAADFDRDGDLDLAAAGDEDVAVYSNLGGGVFEEGAPLAAGYLEYFFPQPCRFDVGDFDRDGWPDLAIGGRAAGGFGSGNSYLAIFRNSNGTLAGPALQYRVGSFPKDVALVDLDGDGWLDGVATCASLEENGWASIAGSSNEIAAAFVLPSLQHAGLSSLLEVYEPVWLPAKPAAGALPDLYGEHGGKLYRAVNRGHGLFAGAQVIGRGEPLVARDLDGDGDEDLLVANHDSLWIQLQLGAAGLGEPRAWMAGATFLGLADADQDGDLDLFASDAAHRVRLRRNDGAGNFGPAEDTGVDAPRVDGVLQPGAARDVNGDGRADLLFAVWKPCEFVSNDGETHFEQHLELVRWPASAAGGFGAPDTSRTARSGEFKTTGGGGSLRFGDWNGDGQLDVACGTNACTSGNRAWFAPFLGHGAAPFEALATLEAGSMCDLAAGDLNGDQLDDLVHIDSPVGYSYFAATLASDGNGGFAGDTWQMGDFPVQLALADLDGDGQLDVITKNWKIPDYSHFSYSIRLNRTPGSQPTPVLVSLFQSRIEGGAVHLEWAGSPAEIFTATVERRTRSTDWVALASRASDATGRLRYVDQAVAAGESYEYRLRLRGEAVVAGGSSWLTIPGAAFALRGAVPNPAIGSPALMFTLPEPGDVEMRLVDIAGRIVRREKHAALDPGAHRVAFGGPALPPGYYLAELEYGSRKLQTSVVIIR